MVREGPRTPPAYLTKDLGLLLSHGLVEEPHHLHGEVTGQGRDHLYIKIRCLDGRVSRSYGLDYGFRYR